MMRLKLAVRNLWRNTRRTALCMIMIMAGFAAIVLFRGFGENLIYHLRHVAIHVQYGHLQIGTTDGWEGTALGDQKKRLITSPEEITKIVNETVRIKRIAPRMSFFGLLGNDETSVAARIEGFDPVADQEVMTSILYVDGGPLKPGQNDGILVGSGLAKQLNAKIGDRLTVMTTTIDGAMNALDVEVVGIITTGMKEFDMWTLYLPIASAQRVLDTDRVERLTVLFDDNVNLDKQVEKLKPALPAGIELRTYRELADLFRQVETYFETQSRVLATIIFALVMLSTLNIIGNSVVERTGEIGTLRSLGEKRRDIVTLFFLEGVILASFSCILGAILGVILCKVLTWFGFLITIPNTTRPVPLHFMIVGRAFLDATGVMFLTSVVGSVWPALKAAKMPVTEALRRNLE